jgi:hypothetical protein
MAANVAGSISMICAAIDKFILHHGKSVQDVTAHHDGVQA